VSRYWYGRALSWAQQSPRDFLALQGRKLAYFWDAFEIPNNQDFYFFSRQTRLFRTSLLSHFGILGPLALVGLVLGSARKRLPFAWAANPITLMAVIVLFFVCGRFRVSLVPLLAIWGGIGVALVVEAIRERRLVWLLLPLGLLVAGAWMSNGDLWDQRKHHSSAESHLRLGIHYASRGEPDRALEHYREATRVNPAFADGWNNLGTLYAASGRPDEAREAFRRAVRENPGHAKALGNLAALAFQQGRRAEADSLARRTIRVAAHDPEALYNAAVVLGNLGDYRAAGAAFHELVDQQPWNAAARLGEAKALLALGKREEARRVLAEHPEDRRSADLQELLNRLVEP
jgi:tetratricopeptide (TPR) repeat protein